VWANLAGDDAATAYQAIWALVAAPLQAVPFLDKHLQSTPLADPRQVASLIRDLNDDRFQVREKAMADLAILNELAEGALRKALAEGASVEAQRRIETLLKRTEKQIVNGDQLRAIRAVEALEQMGTTEARDVLKKLADGAAEARLTQEARESLERLSKASSKSGM
jgi:hypothetical protein